MQLYPKAKKVDEALETLQGFAVGKPVVIEETFPLQCSMKEFTRFIDESEKTAAGWKVYDVMVGGVSLVANYRTEFNNAVRDAGIEGLIENLQTKNRPAAAQAAPAAPAGGKK